MKRILTLILLTFAGLGQAQLTPLFRNLSVNTNGTLRGPTNFFAVNELFQGRRFTNVAEMRAGFQWTNRVPVWVDGYDTPNDGRGGWFIYDPYSTDVPATEQVIAPTNGVGRYTRFIDHGYFPQTKYEIYSPTITRRTMLDPTTSPWQYNHDTTIAYYQDRWFAQWNANTDKRESVGGQVLLQTTSTDFVTWTTPVEMYHSSTNSVNPVTMLSTDTEWQPGMVRVGSELWSIWSRNSTIVPWPTGYKMYFSRLTNSASKWVNTELNITYTDTDGNTYWGFPTQNPIVLKSGRVIAPVIFNSDALTSPPPPGWTTTSYFWINKKRAGCIYTDDNGTTWKLGGVTTLPGYDWSLWEPIIQQTADGGIAMWCRNLDYKAFGSDKFLLWAQGYSDGQFFDPLTPIRIDVSSSRLGMLYQHGQTPRHIGLHNDWRSGVGANFVTSRRNASLYFSRTSAPDMSPGVNFSLDFGSVSYPQGDIHDGKIHVMWTQSTEPNYLMTSEIDPAPDVNKWYISPRQNDAVNPFVVWTNAAPTRFIHNTTSEMESIRSTDSWADTNRVTVGAWVYKDPGGSSTALQTITDNRLLQTGVYGGFIWGTLSGVPLLNLVMPNGTGTNYSFSTLSVPFGEWLYFGLTIDLTIPSATIYVTRANGTSTSETKALGPHAGINGATLYVGRAINNSSWARHVGSVRRIRVINGVAATADQHRFWHGTEQAALSTTDWAGSESDPGLPSFDYNAADGHAGSNDSTWLAEWSQTGQVFRGYAQPSTRSGINTLLITGTGSASVEMPPIGKDQQYVFASQLIITNKTPGADQCFLTIGGLDTQIALVSRAANSNKFELYSRLTERFTELGDYVAGKWIPVTVKIGGGYVTVSLGKTNAIARLNEQQPRLFIGQGYLGTFAPTQLDGFHLDMDHAVFHVGALSQQYTLDADPMVRSMSVVASNATATIKGLNPTLAVESDGGAGYRPQLILNGSVPTITLRDSDNPATNHLILGNTQLRLMQTLTQADTPGLFSWDVSSGFSFQFGPSAKHVIYGTDAGAPELQLVRMNGPFAVPTPPTSGQILGSVLLSGTDGTNVLGGKAGVTARAAENWSYTNTGTSLTLSITPNGSAARINALMVDQDSAVYFGADTNAPSITSGFGAPATTRNNGSLYFRTDGIGPNHYFRVNGGWLAPAMTLAPASFTDLTVTSTLTYTDDAPVMEFNATNGSSGARINIATGYTETTGTFRFTGGFAGAFTLYPSGAIGLSGRTSDPSVLADGKVWYRSDQSQFIGRAGSTTRQLMSGFTGSVVWDIANLASLANGSTTVTVTGAAVGDPVTVSPAMPATGVVVSADVTSANTVTLRAHNVSGGAVDPGSQTFQLKVFKQ